MRTCADIGAAFIQKKERDPIGEEENGYHQHEAYLNFRFGYGEKSAFNDS